MSFHYMGVKSTVSYTVKGLILFKIEQSQIYGRLTLKL